MRVFKFYIAVLLLVGTALVWSCVPEDETTRQQTDIFYLIDPLPDTVFLRGQENITFEIETSDGLNADKIDEVIFYKTLEVPIILGTDKGKKSTETILTRTSTIPSNLTISIQELLNGVIIENFPKITANPNNPSRPDTTFVDIVVNSENDIPPGSFWNVRWEVRSSGQGLSPKDTTEMRYECPSNLAGRYIGTNDYCQSTPLELEIIPDSTVGKQNTYILPDFTANATTECLGGPQLSMQVKEFCGAIAPVDVPFRGLTWSVLRGTWDDNNTLTLTWFNPLDGTVVTSTFIRQ